ncbi:MAG: histidinol dehydrogenase [Deltaproteobacteria bacterium]|nr:MAG: histidinol dehydrogenase [Deltaproteobacteria bacterium]
MKWLRCSEKDFELGWRRVLERRASSFEEVEAQVREIINEVREGGDKALLELTRHLDGLDLKPDEIEVPREEWQRASGVVDQDLKEALLRAKEEIEGFCRRALPRDWMDVKGGVIRGEIFRAVERVGVYVPGGKALYPSSVLMGVIPAIAAGVKEVIVVTPPLVSPVILYACEIAGVRRLFQVGGAQAIAALALGTERIPRVDVIVGPGNRYVTAAKKILYGQVGIDMLAGPSELLVLSDGTTSPWKAALDLLSQAEHDEDAWAVLVTPEEGYAKEVERSLHRLASRTPRRDIVERSLGKNGLIVLCRDLEEAFRLSNEFAPEHLELHLREPWKWLGEVKNAGSVFVGEDTPVVLGDYCAGPNHILPTGGSARFSSPLGVLNFMKRIQFLSVTTEALRGLYPVGARIAQEEGLGGHVLALKGRIKDGEEGSGQSEDQGDRGSGQP